VPHSRGDDDDIFYLFLQCRHEFRGSCANQERNGEPSHLDVNGALDAAVKEKLDHYEHDYNERNFFFLPAVTTTSGRISGDFLRLLYILSQRQAANYFTRMGIIDPSPQAFKQRRGSYFCYNRAAIGLACAQATAVRIDIAPHKHPRKKTLTTSPTPTTLTSLQTPTSTISNPRHLDDSTVYHSIL
jgi:hypothetical protein